MPEQKLPNSDPDLQLARQIKDYLTDNISLSNIDDPLINVLLSYKESVNPRGERATVNEDEIWDQIKTRTQPSEKLSTKIFSLHNRKIWAAAAIVLIAAIFSFLYQQFNDQPTLLAQSNSTIKTIQLSDGSNVTLRPYSSLYSIEKEKSTEIYSLEGEGYFEVTPNTGRTFSVETQTGRVRVLGTRFTLSTWGEQMQVYLEEGSVKVEALEQDSAVVLNPGESASVNNKNAVPAVTVGHAREFMDWLDQQLIFEDRPAEQIVSELEQQFNISIILPAAISGSTLTGQLSLANLQTSLQDLELALGGEFNQTSERTYTFEAN